MELVEKNSDEIGKDSVNLLYQKRSLLSRLFIGGFSIMVSFSKIGYQKAHLFMYMGNPSKWLKQ